MDMVVDFVTAWPNWHWSNLIILCRRLFGQRIGPRDQKEEHLIAFGLEVVFAHP